MSKPRILAFAGSAREASYNKRLLKIAAEATEDAGAKVTRIDLADYSLPLFNQDLEELQGTPDNARRLKDLFFAHDGLLIASPEYNSSITPLLKNTIDWVSRKAEGEQPLEAFRGKVAGIIAASPGRLGGLRGLWILRMLLGNIGVMVLPQQLAVSKAHEAIGTSALKDEQQQSVLKNIAEQLVFAAGQLSSGM